MYLQALDSLQVGAIPLILPLKQIPWLSAGESSYGASPHLLPQATLLPTNNTPGAGEWGGQMPFPHPDPVFLGDLGSRSLPENQAAICWVPTGRALCKVLPQSLT